MLAPWVEAALPLGIICVLVTGMGALPMGAQQLFYGKPKAVLLDGWDTRLQKRDAALLKVAADQK